MDVEKQRQQQSCDDVARRWQQLSSDFYRISAALDRALESGHRLSGCEFDVLERLANSDSGQLRMGELAPDVALSQSALSRLVTRLEERGVVDRVRYDEDRRSVYARLTNDGVELYEAARPTQRAALLASSLGCEVGDLICENTHIY